MKFNREYEDIVEELSQAIGSIQDCHDSFEMSQEEWNQLEEQERVECTRTLADDLFYGLGNITKITIGSGRIEYDPDHHLIKVFSVPQVVHMIHLI